MKKLWQNFLVVLLFLCFLFLLGLGFYIKWSLTWGRIK